MISLPNNLKRLPGPVRWYGGKGNMLAKILPLIPPSKVYCEPYGGAGSILCNLEPRQVEVYNDLDNRLVNLFRVLQNKEQRERLQERLEFTLYSLEEFRLALQEQHDPDPVKAAWGFFVAQNQGFSGEAKSEGNWSKVFVANRGMAETTSKWRSRVANLDRWGERFAQVQIDSRCALQVIRYWDSADTVFYLDPPYVLDTRKGRTCYQHEQDDSHHQELIALLPTLKGKVVLSGYDHPIYQPLTDAGWQVIRWDTACHAAGRLRNNKLQGKGNTLKHAARTEVVWRSPNCEPKELFNVEDEKLKDPDSWGK